MRRCAKSPFFIFWVDLIAFVLWVTLIVLAWLSNWKKWEDKVGPFMNFLAKFYPIAMTYFILRQTFFNLLDS